MQWRLQVIDLVWRVEGVDPARGVLRIVQLSMLLRVREVEGYAWVFCFGTNTAGAGLADLGWQ